MRGPEDGFEWQLLGAGELIARIDEVGIQGVTEHLGTDWTWDSAEFGVLTDEDGTVTEWATLKGARRRHLTATPSLEEELAA